MGALVKHLGKAVLATAMMVLSPSAMAQQAPTTVSAADPAGMARVLEYAGYSTELTTDDFGDPKIETEFSGWSGAFIFYGCDEDTHEACDSVQLQVGLDRAEPTPAELVNELMANERYFGIRLDAEGDPWIEWDIVTGTGEGIPAPVFMKAVNYYAMQVETVADKIFAEERQNDVDRNAENEPEETT